jgi:hypothetical protein
VLLVLKPQLGPGTRPQIIALNALNALVNALDALVNGLNALVNSLKGLANALTTLTVSYIALRQRTRLTMLTRLTKKP